MAIYDTTIDDSYDYSEVLLPHDFAAVVPSDSVTFDDLYVAHDFEAHYSDSFDYALEDFHFNERPAGWDDTIDFGTEVYDARKMSARFSDSITYSETRKATPDPVRLHESFQFFELFNADNDYINSGWFDAFDYSETLLRSYLPDPTHKIQQESLLFSELYTPVKTKILSSNITYLEGWCLQFQIGTSFNDHIAFNDAFRRTVNDPRDVRNNPVLISDGSGYTFSAVYKKKQRETIKFVELYQLVDASGYPISVDPCHPGIIAAPLSWSMLTEDDWVNLTEGQWAQMVE